MKMNNWIMQLVRIQDKGFKAFYAGIPLSQNPYTGGYHNQNGPGGSLQRQRREAWDAGWNEGKRHKKEYPNGE